MCIFFEIFCKKALDKCKWLWYHMWVRESVWPAALAQLDRVFGYEPKGRGFESLTPRHKTKGGCPKDIHLLFYATSLHDSEPPHKQRNALRYADLRRIPERFMQPLRANTGSESLTHVTFTLAKPMLSPFTRPITKTRTRMAAGARVFYMDCFKRA